jgi:hypothetical protein
MPVIIITNIRNVSVGGSPVGSLVNAFNESKDPVAVQIALESFCDNLETAHINALASAAKASADALDKLNASHASQAGDSEAASKAASESHASELAELTASHAEAIAVKDAQLKAQVDEAWEAIRVAANNHADIVNELEYQHAADLAKAAADLAAAVEAEGRAVHNRLDALVQAGQEAHAAGDLDALGKVLVAAYAHTSPARRAKLEADLATAQTAVTAAADKLAAL